MNDRIKKLRKTLGLTQREFGERTGIKPNTVATYEIGRNQPIDAVISLICREFNVNETWLRTGEGEMFVEKPETRLDELALEFNLDELDRKMMLGYLRLSPSDRMVIKRYMQNVLDGVDNDAQQPNPFTSTTDQNQHTELTGKQSTTEPNLPIPEGSTPEIEAEVARIREELILEKSMKTSWESTPAGAG